MYREAFLALYRSLINFYQNNRQQHEQRTCPMCREAISEGDEYWELTDVPDKEEMHSYVVSLASGIPSLPS